VPHFQTICYKEKRIKIKEDDENKSKKEREMTDK
jgi:hypothetical protein